MNLTIKHFGRIAEICGKGEEVVILEKSDTENLKLHLFKKYPSLESTAFKIAVDEQIISTNIELNENSSIALLPPFSGG